MISYPRRQQIRRLMRAARCGGCAVIAVAAAILVASADRPELALSFGLIAVVLGVSSRRALRLAGRSRIGADSEAYVRRALKALRREGWRVRHAVDCAGAGDLDHVARAPSGIGFVIETKTQRYMRAHVLRTAAAARWLGPRPWRYPAGVRPVICLARARRLERMENGVLVVSLDRLTDALRRAAASHSDPRPEVEIGRRR